MQRMQEFVVVLTAKKIIRGIIMKFNIRKDFFEKSKNLRMQSVSYITVLFHTSRMSLQILKNYGFYIINF